MSTVRSRVSTWRLRNGLNSELPGLGMPATASSIANGDGIIVDKVNLQSRNDESKEQ